MYSIEKYHIHVEKIQRLTGLNHQNYIPAKIHIQRFAVKWSFFNFFKTLNISHNF